jgi:hypothetical protein
MAGGDKAKLILMPCQRIIEIVHMRAGNPEYGAHTVCDERFCDCLTGR